MGVELVSRATSDRTRGHSVKSHRFRSDIRKDLLTGRLDIGTGCPGTWWSCHPPKSKERVDVALRAVVQLTLRCLVTAGLCDLRDLFQPGWFCGSELHLPWCWVGWAQCPALRGMGSVPCSEWAAHHNTAQHTQEGLALQGSASLCSPSLSALAPTSYTARPGLVMGQSTRKTGQDLTADKSFLGPGCQESLWQSQDHSVESRNPG